MDIRDTTVPYATLGEVQAGKGSERVMVEDDVLDVVRRLKEIHPGLNVQWNAHQEYFTIYEVCADGRERIVTNVKELDPRLIAHFEQLAHDSWDAVAEMEKMDDQAEKDRQYNFAQKVGEIGERLHHALRKDFGIQDRIWLPERFHKKIVKPSEKL